MGRAVTSFVFASADSLEATASRLSQALDLTFALHDSSHRGGDYLLAGDQGTEHFIVQRNEDGEEPAEPVDAPTVVYAEATERPERVQAVAAEAGLTLVRRDDWVRS